MNKEEIIDAMFDAVESSDIKIIKQLFIKYPWLKCGGNFNYSGCSYLRYAVDNHDYKLIKDLIELEININQEDKLPLSETALCHAVDENQIEIVNCLLSNKAFVDGTDLTAITPLMIASRNGNLDLIKLLIKHGADVNRLGYIQRYFPVDFAKSYGHIECEKYLREVGGISVSEDYDWENAVGYPIIAFISNEYGAVYPISFPRKINEKNFDFRLAQARTKDETLCLFSAGLYLSGQLIEVCISLPSRWPLLRKYREENTKLSFPIDFLSVLSEQIYDGRVLTVGDIFDKSMEGYEYLGWPDEVSSLVVINHQVNKDDSDETDEDDVQILTLVPMMKNATAMKAPSSLKKWCESRSRAKWSKLSLPMPY